MTFDEYRARYDELTDDEHKAAYDEWFAKYPEQAHYTRDAVAAFIAAHPLPVIEIGGWDGALAAEMLRAFPGLPSWDSIDICRAACRVAAQRLHAEPRRFVIWHPESFRWWRNLDWRPTLPPSSIVCSHTIEHLSDADALSLIESLPNAIRAIYLESPLKSEGQTWDGYAGSHVLTLGWNAIDEALERKGFAVASRSGDVSTYERRA